MNAICHRFAVLALFFLAATSHADDAAKVRPTLQRSLGFLTKAGDSWMAEKNCVACHHMALLIQCESEALQRGFNVDPRKVDAWTDWCLLLLDKAQGGVEVYAELALAVPAARPQLHKLILAKQEKDGLWKSGGQFESMQQRSLKEAQEATTRLTLLALLATDGDKGAQGRALAALGSVKEADSTETLAWRARLGTGDKPNFAVAELLRRQHPDGGWAWRTGEWISDALATGEVMYALKDVPSAKEALAQGRAWLIANQSADGSWPIDASLISQLKRKDFTAVNGIYTFWGTAWATLALLQEVPGPCDAMR